MMPRPPRIRVYDSDHPPGDWRRFVALLCFMEFWVQFIWNGRALVAVLTSRSWRRPDDELLSLVTCGANVCMALYFWSLGRALWRGHPRVWRHIAGILVCSTFVVWADAAGLRNAHFTFRGMDWAQGSFNLVIELAFRHVDQVRWLFLLLASCFLPRNWSNKRRSPWVFLAAAWSLGMAASAIELLPESWWNLSLFILGTTSFDSQQILAAVSVGLPVLLAVWLFVTQRLAWSIPLILALLHLLNIATYALRWVPTVRCADGSWKLVLNQRAFDLLFVRPFWFAGAWLLIAFWAWRYPARAPADDGTPLPRRHCAKCLYNLQGLSSDRCPECGAYLGPPEEEDGAVRRPVLSTTDR